MPSRARVIQQKALRRFARRIRTAKITNWAQVHLDAGDLPRVLLTTAAYAAVQAVAFAIKFFDNWVLRSTSTNAA
jgi:hypothetical protein